MDLCGRGDFRLSQGSEARTAPLDPRCNLTQALEQQVEIGIVARSPSAGICIGNLEEREVAGIDRLTQFLVLDQVLPRDVLLNFGTDGRDLLEQTAGAGALGDREGMGVVTRARIAGVESGQDGQEKIIEILLGGQVGRAQIVARSRPRADRFDGVHRLLAEALGPFQLVGAKSQARQPQQGICLGVRVLGLTRVPQGLLIRVLRGWQLIELFVD